MVTAVEKLTEVVEMANVALVLPGATVTLAGTAATVGALLARAITVPAGGAAVLSVTVPVDCAPPVTLVGSTRKSEMTAGVTTVTTDFVLPSSEAKSSTEVFAVTGLVSIVKEVM
jgi:hypothetical protein